MGEDIVWIISHVAGEKKCIISFFFDLTSWTLWVLLFLQAAHPTWKCSPSGQNLIGNVETYQHDQTIAIARERQHHIEATAWQLETFTQLERRTHDPGNSDTIWFE